MWWTVSMTDHDRVCVCQSQKTLFITDWKDLTNKQLASPKKMCIFISTVNDIYNSNNGGRLANTLVGRS